MKKKGRVGDSPKSETTKQGDVPNYGYALAPYVLSLSLFVGAIALNIIYPRKSPESLPNTLRHNG